MPATTRPSSLLVVLAAVASLAACDKARPVAGGATGRCTGCHGGLNDTTGAPPTDTAGRSSTAELTVGAHGAHLAAGLACSACHKVPSVANDPDVPEHLDGRVEVVFGGVALLGGGTAPAWDPSTGTCSNVYCHGAKLDPGARGQSTTPTWTGLPPTLVPSSLPSSTPACGGCHGSFSSNGAPAGHGAGLTLQDCARCHLASVSADGVPKPASGGGLHLDGKVDVDSTACTGCHGDASRPETVTRIMAAPPADTHQQTTGSAVGAHLRHVSTVPGLGSRLSKPIDCDECHAVPTVVPHPAGAVVRLEGPLATADNLRPGYSGGTCSNVYCHGATLPGGSSKVPSWTQSYADVTAGAGGECGTCHFAANPPTSHPQADTLGAAITATTQCNQCHAGTVKPDGTINLSLGLHVNGLLDVKPHADGWVAPTVHGRAAKLDLAGCAASACHGADFGNPVSDGRSCNSCHADPSRYGLAGAKHPTWQSECTFCHGESNRALAAGQDSVGTPAVNAVRAAPPLGSQDESAASANAVGAHLRHASDDPTAGNRYGAPIRCQECHGGTLPGNIDHVDGLVTIGWVDLAGRQNVTPTPAAGNLARATAVTCTNYCHGGRWIGNAAYAGSVTSPSWTGSLPTASACGACHKAPPASPAHGAVTSTKDCGDCHTGYACTTANLSGCAVNKATHLNGALDVVALACNTCHGSSANAAPPAATSTVNSAVKIGAHQAHLVKSNLRSAVLGCVDCHTVPTSTSHASGTVDLTWGALARTGVTPTPSSLNATAQASWEATPTCTNYCHGGGFSAAIAGSGTAPTWTGAAVNTACGSCHKAPPATAAHASVTATKNCGDCHDGYSCTTANLSACSVDKAKHLNGVVDVPTLGCNTCHGSATNAAPPAATSTTNSAVKVGAHQAHLVKSNLRSAVLGCVDCHSVPPTAPHANGTVDMTWGTLARTGTFTPTPANLGPATSPTQATWEATPTCTNYCHGSGFAAAVSGTGTTPAWTGAAVNTACGSCHKAPPTNASHASVTATTNCGTCHTGYSCTTANLSGCTVNKTAHLNGAIDAPSMTCTSCHGSATNAAPPAATSTTNSAVKVGAHQAHLVKSNLRSAVLGCVDCHTVPTSTSHASGTVDLTWGALARTGVTPTPSSLNATAQATWEATPTCTNYCHGSGFASAVKGTGATPSWTGAAVNTACGSCHQAPPATAGHSTVTSATDCGSCHTGYTCTTANLAACTVNKTLHLNGAIDAPSLNCTSCHGSAANAAPPVATSTTNSAVKIGAHQAHLVKSNLRSAVLGCVDCHTVPGSTSHSTGIVDMTWGALARTGTFIPTPGNLGPATSPTWATWEATPTCTNYCHGSGFAAAVKGTGATPSWTGAAVSTACGSCHQAPPATAGHSTVTSATDCGSCHTGYTCTTANLAACTVNKTLHLNGAIDAPSLNCTSCHGSAANAAPPVATSTTNSAVKIGAHQAHLVKSNLRSAVLGCVDCHTVPGSTSHSTGIVDMTWGALARTGTFIPTPGNLGPATSPTWATWEATPTCTNYCHGSGFAAAVKGTGATPSWTGAAVSTACGSCHQAPPATAGHSTVTSATDCGSCHTGYTCTTANLAACTVNKTAHLNGTIDAPSLTCTTCHGNSALTATAASPLNAAPPVDTAGASTGVAVGAHQAHLVKANLRSAALACGDCHANVGSYTTSHASGIVDMTWGALARTGTFTPTPANLGPATSPTQATWEASPTCTNYCHGSGFAAAVKGTGATPSWTGAAVNTACGSCHQAPPATADHSLVTSTTNCGNCHTGYSCTTANLAACAVNKAIHLDGTVQGSAESAGGAACGGCHATILQGMNGTVTKASRHLLGSDAAAGAALTWSNPLSANAAASRTCTNMCHGDHPHDATSPVSATHEANVYSDAGTSASRAGVAGTRVVTGGTGTVNRAKSDFDAAATNGGLCVSCHQYPVDATHPAVTKAGFSTGAHNFTAGWQFQLHSGAFDRNCTKCHASAAEGTTPLASASGSATAAVHFGDNASLLAGKVNPAGTAAGFVCYNCHGSTASPAPGAQGNRSGKDIQSQIVHATTAGQSGHPANTDAVHASVAEESGAAFGNTLGGKARHSGCLDCHDSHEARAGTHVQGTNLAGPPLQGAWGAQLSSSPAAWAAPTSTNFTKKTIVAGTDLEATLCFKCHSGFYGTLPTSPSGGYAETDQAKEFNTANVGFHSVLGTNSATAGNTGNLVSPWTRTSLMTCSDCHESDVTTDPSGPHGAASKFILKGPNTKWDATLVSNGASAWMPAGTFCLNCHNNTASSSRFTAHSRGDHSIACFNCHAAIPHGGPRPGMLVAGAGAATGVGGTIAGWDTTAPYWRGTTSDRLYIKSYPASNTTTWSQSNCGCNGTGH